MSRVAVAVLFSFGFVLGCFATVPGQSAGEAYRPKEFTHAGWVHEGCEEFRDPEEIVGKGQITGVEVAYGDFIHGIRLCYGRDHQGLFHLGLPENELSRWSIQRTSWKIPEGEIIVGVEGEISGHYISRLKFITDRGTESRWFGGKSGSRFYVNEPDSGGLRTISGYVNKRRHKSLARAVASMTFYFDPPCYIKDIKYDLAALEAARIKATPEGLARQEIPNGTSVEQSVVYQDTKTITASRTLTFQQSFGFNVGGEVLAGLPGVASAKTSFAFSANTALSKTYANATMQEVSWSVPVKVPPGKKIVVVSTVKRYQAVVPFTYTVAWYWGTRDNIVREVTLPGMYEGVHVEDLKHDFSEASLE